MIFGVCVFLAVGGIAGILAGLLGIGGGLIIVAALAWLLPAFGIPEAYLMHVALATALASIIVTAAASSWAHHKRKAVVWPWVRVLAPGLMAGALFGAWCADRLATNQLRLVVGSFCLLMAVQMFLQRDAPVARARRRAGVMSGIGWGGLIGFVSAFVGIGGGSMTVPLLIHYEVAPVRAIASSAVCGFWIALAGFAGYAMLGQQLAGLPQGSLGYVYVPAAALIAFASACAAPWGAALAHRLDGRFLRRVFAVFLCAVSAMQFKLAA